MSVMQMHRFKRAWRPPLTPSDVFDRMERDTTEAEDRAGLTAEVLLWHRQRNHVAERLAAAYREVERR